MSRNIVRILAAVGFAATVPIFVLGQTQPPDENQRRGAQPPTTNVSTVAVHHSPDPRLKALEIGPTNGLLAFYKSERPLTLIDPAKANSVTNGITLKQLVQNLGPGWRSPRDGIGLISWTFRDGRELQVLRPRFNETAAKAYTSNRIYWFTNRPIEIVKTNDPVPQPRYVKF